MTNAQVRNADYSLNDNNQDLMELLEWLDYKYEAHLKQADLINYEKITFSSESKKSEFSMEIESLKILSSDHRNVIDSLSEKIVALDKMIALMESLESQGTAQRMEVEEVLESIQFKIQKMSSNQLIAETC